MSINAFQRQGDPVEVGWKIGHAPLWMRGIRLAEGEGGAAPAAPAAPSAPGAPPAAPAPSPAQVAAFYAAQNGAQPPAPSPAPQAPAAPQIQQLQGFTPEQVQRLMADADTANKAAADAQAALAAAQQERDDFQAQVTAFNREKAVTTAAGAAEKAGNAALLLDSASFQASIKDIDFADAAALGAAVTKFVTENPAYAAAPAATLPSTSGGTPAGGSTTKPTGLEGAIAARLAG